MLKQLKFSPARFKTNFRINILFIILITGLYGCNRSDSTGESEDSQNSTNSGLQNGTFLDSPVAGLTYKTATQSGITDSNGQYQYLSGETIHFSVGDIKIGSVTGSNVLSPTQMIAGNENTAHTTVIKILQFLQTIDDDTNPNNGIQISAATRQAAAGQLFDFNNDTESQLSLLVNQLMSSTKRLITRAEATNHFNKSLIQQFSGTYQGTWIDNNENGSFEFELDANGVITTGSWRSAARNACAFNGRINADGILTWVDCDGDAGLISITLSGSLGCSSCSVTNNSHSMTGNKVSQGVATITAATPVCKARPHSLLPALTGDYCVGTRIINMTDTSRSQTFSEETGNRRLMVQMWYPTDTTTTGTFAKYMDASAYTWMIETFKMNNLFTLPNDADEQISPHGMVDVPLAQNGEKFPVIIFSPALRFVVSTYTSFIEQLASHGYIVVAVNHTHVSGVTTFPETAEVIGFSSDIPALGVTDAQFETVVQDIRFLIDQLELLNVSDTGTASLQQRMKLTNMGMLGHSLGGTIAQEICKEDPRVVACSNMDGIPRADSGSTGSDAPILQIRSVVINNDGVFNDFFNVNNKSTFMLRIPKAGHSNFSDGAIMIDHFIPAAATANSLTQSLIGLGQVNSMLTIEVSNAMNLGFFNHYLKGAPFSQFISIPAGFFESPTTKPWNTILNFAISSEPIFRVK